MSSPASCDGGGVNNEFRKLGGGEGDRESALSGELGTSSSEEERTLDKGEERPDSLPDSIFAVCHCSWKVRCMARSNNNYLWKV